MGQTHSTEEWKELFHTLDKDQTGRLNLRELLSSDLPEIAGTSVGFLFRFDVDQEGTLSFKEFQELIKYLRRLESRKTQKKSRFRRFLRRSERSSSDDEVDEFCWTALDSKETAGMILNRNDATPAFIGGSRRNSEEEERKSDELSGQWSEERKTRDFLGHSLRKSEGRQKFMNWLFKLADIDKNDRVKIDELELFLRALARDQINTAELSYDQEQITPLLLQSIMGEYDIGKTGYLDKEEFMVLAELIVRNYDTLVEEDTNTQIVGDYALRWKLGEGASGVVRLGVHRKTKKHVAIKIIPKGDASDLSRVDNEIKAMLMLKHPNVVQLEEVLEGEEKVYFVMELCGGGSIADYAAIHPLSEDLARYYFFQLVQVVQYCHSLGVVHRDLKLENLLLDNEGVVHVSDFGHAGIFQSGWDMFSTAVGSLYHLSPEQINGECYSGEKTDTWAMGVALYRMLVGHPPFFSSDINQLLEDIRTVNYTIPEYLSKDAQSLLREILQLDPKDRPQLSEVLVHPWLASHKSCNPSIMVHPLHVRRHQLDTKTLVTTLRTLDVVVVNATSSLPSHSTIFCHLKCHYPPKGLKFSIALIETKESTIGDKVLRINIHSDNRLPSSYIGSVISSPNSLPIGEIPFPSASDANSDDEVQANHSLVPSGEPSLLSRSEQSVLPPTMHMRASSDLTPLSQSPKSRMVTPSRLKCETTPERSETPEMSATEDNSSSSTTDPLIVLMEVQLRQGNLSELNKLMERVLTSPWFHVPLK